MRRIQLILAAILCLFPLKTFAWHQPGHMLTALIAYEQLDAATQSKLVEILKKHPRFQEDFATDLATLNLSTDEQSKWIFCRASIWSDLVRPSKYEHANPKIPPDPTDRTSYHREQWHFINRPIILLAESDTPALEKQLLTEAKKTLNLDKTPPAAEDMNMNVVQAIAFNSNRLKQSSVDADRAVALCWVIHCVGDVHQPLHCVALFTQDLFKPGVDEGDRGGNNLRWSPSSNLHSLWDDAPDSNNDFAHIETRVDDLLSNPQLKTAGDDAIKKMGPSTWADESFDLANSDVYTSEIREQVLDSEQLGKDPQTGLIIHSPDQSYRSNAKTVSEKRVVEGGFRLAALLKSLAL